LYFHGGGFVCGSPRTHRALAADLSRACGARLLLPDYRLAPEHPHPAAANDCLASYRELLEAGQLPEQILIGGDSAGGFLALQTLLAIRDSGLPAPCGAILLSPLTDAQHIDGESYRDRRNVDIFLNPDGIRYLTGLYAGSCSGDGDVLCPQRRDLSGLPPLLVQVGDHEVLLTDSLRLAERARRCGVDVRLEVFPEMWHVFQVFATAEPEARRAIGEIGCFAREMLARAGATLTPRSPTAREPRS
jgi:acetyl esterase/lipase